MGAGGRGGPPTSHWKSAYNFTGSPPDAWFHICRFSQPRLYCFLVQLLRHVWLFVTPWMAAYQASPSITNSWSLLKLMSIKSEMLSNHLILCRPLFLLPSVFPSIRVFSNELALHIRWSKYWSFSFSISPSNEYLVWFLLVLTGLISLQFKGLSRVFSSTALRKHQFSALSLLYGPTLTSIHEWLLEKP